MRSPGSSLKKLPTVSPACGSWKRIGGAGCAGRLAWAISASRSLSRPRSFQAVKAQAVPCVGQAINAAEHGGHGPKTGASGNQEHDQDLVFDRFGRRYSAEDLTGHHAGKKTSPVAAIELMVGISALRSASRVTGVAAIHLVAPSISCASTLARRFTSPVVSVSRPRAMPVMQFPRIIPSSGMA